MSELTAEELETCWYCRCGKAMREDDDGFIDKHSDEYFCSVECFEAHKIGDL